MATKDLRKDLRSIDKDAWWYELREGIEIIVPLVTMRPAVINGDSLHLRISWKVLRSALARKDKK